MEYKTYTASDRHITHVIKCRPEEIEIKVIGNTLHVAKVNGINAGYFDLNNPKETIWSMCVNNGKPVKANIINANPNVRRGFIYWTGKEMKYKRINKLSEITDNVVWGMSGIALHDFNKKADVLAADTYRTCQGTMFGYDKDNNVYLIVRSFTSVPRQMDTMRNLGLVAALRLDCGGSTQLNYNGKGYKSTRKISTAICIK